MQENIEPDKPKIPKDQENTPPELEEPSVSGDTPVSEPEEQKPDKSEEPKDQEDALPDLEEPSDSEDAPEPEFEEQKGEVLPPENKKGNGCGLFIFILLLFTVIISYLYYTDQIPKKMMEQIEPLLKPLEQEFVKLKPQSTARNSKKWTPEVDKETPDPSIQKEIKKTPFPIEEHISGFQMESTPEVDKGITKHMAKVSGETTLIKPEPETLVKKSEVKTQVPESEREMHKTETQIYETETEEPGVEIEKEKTPSISPTMAPAWSLSRKPTQKPIEETAVDEKPAKRSKAVQAYLDFVESTMIKAGELIKEGFFKGKDFLLKSVS